MGKDFAVKSNRIRAILLILLTVAVLSAAGSLLASRYWLKATQYTLKLPGLQEQVQMVMLSDLHGMQYGQDNEALVRLVEKQQPDLIVLVGDMLPDNAQQAQRAALETLLRKLRAIAPVYVSCGNTEIPVTPELQDTVAAADAVLLEKEFVDITVNGTQLRLGGMYSYAFRHNLSQTEWESTAAYHFLVDYQNTELPKVLLCHRPDSFLFYDAFRDWDIDLLLCGHTHGGVIRFPFLGGLYAPDQGWLPEYDYGAFYLENMQMIITSGFAGHDWIPRLNNRPEIVLLTLMP